MPSIPTCRSSIRWTSRPRDRSTTSSRSDATATSEASSPAPGVRRPVFRSGRVRPPSRRISRSISQVSASRSLCNQRRRASRARPRLAVRRRSRLPVVIGKPDPVEDRPGRCVRAPTCRSRPDRIPGAGLRHERGSDGVIEPCWGPFGVIASPAEGKSITTFAGVASDGAVYGVNTMEALESRTRASACTEVGASARRSLLPVVTSAPPDVRFAARWCKPGRNHEFAGDGSGFRAASVEGPSDGGVRACLCPRTGPLTPAGRGSSGSRWPASPRCSPSAPAPRARGWPRRRGRDPSWRLTFADEFDRLDAAKWNYRDNTFMHTNGVENLFRAANVTAQQRGPAAHRPSARPTAR